LKEDAANYPSIQTINLIQTNVFNICVDSQYHQAVHIIMLSEYPVDSGIFKQDTDGGSVFIAD